MPLALIAALAMLQPAADAPRMLIVLSSTGGDPNSPLADIFAATADADRRVTSIVWGLTDPIFREAAAQNLLGNVPDSPSKKDIFSVAGKLKADYVAIVSGNLAGGSAIGNLVLYRGEREIFRDQEKIGIQRSGQIDESSSWKSIAQTWLDKLSQSAFKSLAVVPKVTTVPMAPALVTPVEPAVAPPVDNSSLQVAERNIRSATEREIDRIQKTKTADVEVGPVIADLRRSATQAVIAMYRDAVDAEPLNFERRKMLYDAVLAVDPKLAATEARRAAKVMPEQIELRLLAARAWLAAKDEAQAQADLNEAIARDPNSANVRILLAEIALKKLDAATALEHAEKAVIQSDSPVTRRLRALTRSLLGGVDGVKSDLAAAKDTANNDESKLFLTVLDAAFDDSISSVKSLMQRAIVRPKDEAVRDGIESMTRTLTSRIAFLDSVAMPVTSRDIAEKLLLAHKLLQQCVVDLRDYATATNEDSLNDSRINLGEAIRILGESRSHISK